MQISQKAWNNYIAKMSRINQTAASKMQEYVAAHGLDDMQKVIEYALSLTDHYGEAVGSLACQMYEATAAAQGVTVPTAEMADLPDYGDVAKAVYGAKKTSEGEISKAIGRLVKMVGADTTLKNAERDGAQFAWVPHGDTCAFCITLASRGWQYMSKNALRNGHAEHIHANCDCQYAIRLDGKSTVAGYNPDKYREMYENAEGSTSQEKINSMRRAMYKQKQESNGFAPLTSSKAMDVLRKESRSWIRTLSEDEIKAIKKYTYNPGDEKPNRLFERINAMLRGDTPNDEMLQGYADTISNALKKNSFEHDVIAYRRLDKDIYKDFEIGDLFTEAQFISTSVSKEGALTKPYEITIRVPKGSRAAYIEEISKFPRQRELLLDRDNVFRVLSKENQSIELEVII